MTYSLRIFVRLIVALMLVAIFGAGCPASPVEHASTVPSSVAISLTTPAAGTRTPIPQPTPTAVPSSAPKAPPARTRRPYTSTPVRPRVARTVQPTRTPASSRTPTPLSAVVSSVVPGPSQVTVAHADNRFQLRINDQPMYVTGMNYNVSYTGLGVDEQIQLHRRDFQIMYSAGVNAIIGWGIYDAYTLQVAQEFGIGVIMPFELEPQGPYENQDYRNEIKAAFRDYIVRYKDYPAVWGWNPGGDELLYRMQTEEHRTVDKLQLAADFEWELVQLAHSLDPNHVNVIKEPRDWYIKYLGDSMHRTENRAGFLEARASLVYGVNVYGHPDDINLALTNARLTLTDQLGIAMLVTEFGPFNSLAAERPLDYVAIWDVVAQSSELGGLVYVFGPDQPNPNAANPYDLHTLLPSEYSLVDNKGNPVDSSLSMLTNEWRRGKAN